MVRPLMELRFPAKLKANVPTVVTGPPVTTRFELEEVALTVVTVPSPAEPSAAMRMEFPVEEIATPPPAASVMSPWRPLTDMTYWTPVLVGSVPCWSLQQGQLVSSPEKGKPISYVLYPSLSDV